MCRIRNSCVSAFRNCCTNRVLSGMSPSNTLKPLYSGAFSTPGTPIWADFLTK